MQASLLESRTALIDGEYRYRLTRTWDSTLSHLLIVGHNPSTADASRDDATSRRFFGFAKAWGFGSYTAVNVAALMATDKTALPRHPDPFGPRNRYHVLSAANEADKVVVACGTPNWRRGREEAWDLIGELSRRAAVFALGDGREPKLTAEGFPVHMLYQPSGLLLTLFREAWA